MVFLIIAMDIDIIHKYFQKLVSLILVAFFNPNGITFHSNKPNFLITTVFQMSSSTILICQNPNYKSNVKNQDDFPSYVSINGTRK
jgi:hypothetical protein